jgi:hypothetical protein
MKRRLTLSLFAATALFGSPVAAGPRECVEAHEAGVSAFQSGKLLTAKERLRACTDHACPKIVQTECIDLLGKVNADIPSVVFEASDAAGADLTDVSVTVDGLQVTERLDGRALELDPGERKIQFETRDGKTVEFRVLIKQGDKNRRVTARFVPELARGESEPASSDRALPEERAGPPAGAWILTGLGVAALGSFAFFALSGKSKQEDLESRCAPSCSSDEYSSMKNQYLAADISLGVAVVSLGVATALFLSSGKSEKQETARIAPRAGVSATALSVGLGGSF